MCCRVRITNHVALPFIPVIIIMIFSSWVTGIQFLNTNHNLYKAVSKAEQDGCSLTEEAQRAAHYLRVDFEKGGIHLCTGNLSLLTKLILHGLFFFTYQ